MLPRRLLPSLVIKSIELGAVRVAAYFFPLKWSMSARTKVPTEQMSSIKSLISIARHLLPSREESQRIKLPTFRGNYITRSEDFQGGD